MHEAAVEVLPFVDGEAVAHLRAELSELLTIVHRRGFADDRALVKVLLQGQQELIGVDGLDEVVGDLTADGLVHQLFLLALGDHDDGEEGAQLLDALQGIKACNPRHVLVEEDEVEVLGLYGFDSVGAAEDGRHFVALLLEEEDMWLEQIDFVVCPEDLIYFVAAHTLRR